MNEMNIDAEAQDERDKEFIKTYIETLQDRGENDECWQTHEFK